MRLRLLITGWFVAVFFAGLLCGHALCRSIPCRTAIGFLFGRGRLLALVHGSGIYEQDVLRKAQELRFANGVDEMIGSAEGMEKGPILARLVANEGIDYLAQSEKISRLVIDRQYSLLQSQFRDRRPGHWRCWKIGFRRGCLDAKSPQTRALSAGSIDSSQVKSMLGQKNAASSTRQMRKIMLSRFDFGQVISFSGAIGNSTGDYRGKAPLDRSTLGANRSW